MPGGNQTRRQWMRHVSGSVIGAGLLGGAGARLSGGTVRGSAAEQMAPSYTGPRKRVGAVVTIYHTRTHAQQIIDRFLMGMPLGYGGPIYRPHSQIVSLYADQVPKEDLSRSRARQFGFSVHDTVAGALQRGGGSLDVDAVLLIGEHGDYPENEKGQKLYPRYELFRQIVEVFERSGRSVPVFSDKHLSYSWEKARWMYDKSRELKFNFMAGSSVTVTWRSPELELPLGARVEEAVAVGAGSLEGYGFHMLESLQCMVERRAGGETGVAAVQYLEGPAVWKLLEERPGTRALLEAALGRSVARNMGRPQENCFAPLAFRVDYADGLRGTVFNLNGYVTGFTFAARLAGQREPASCRFVIPPAPGPHNFSCLARNIDRLFNEPKPPYAVERTLLVTGTLAFLLDSRFEGHRKLETPQLNVRYQAPADSAFCRGSVPC